LSGRWRERRAAESAQTAKNAELEALTKSQADKIAELEKTCADLQQEKDNVIVGYRKLAVKHKAFAKKMEQEKIQLVEA
jgi:hypothetical protein